MVGMWLDPISIVAGVAAVPAAVFAVVLLPPAFALALSYAATVSAATAAFSCVACLCLLLRLACRSLWLAPGVAVRVGWNLFALLAVRPIAFVFYLLEEELVESAEARAAKAFLELRRRG